LFGRFKEDRVASSVEAYDTADSEAEDTVAVLEELLGHSIQLRDLYKYGRLQTGDSRFRHLCDSHYTEQLRVVDVLIDRIRMLGGSGRVFASDFLQGAQFSNVRRGRWSLTGLLRELLDMHESALSVARPLGRHDRSWAHDFAVGQVVLTNELQAWSVGNCMCPKGGMPGSILAGREDGARTGY
jgi:DNA-binding ferritin-like protein